MLLVLDNFEHLLEAAPFVAELLANCHGVAVLATSRAPLGIGGEHELPVPPLSVATPEEMTTPERLADPGDAVRLFVQRAQAVRSRLRAHHRERVDRRRASAGASMGCRWRSSSRRRARAFFRRARCWRGSTSASTCCGATRVIFPSATGRFAR